MARSTRPPSPRFSPDYPDVLFITQGGDVMTANQFPTFMAFEETCYLLGIVAGNISTTGNLGFVLGGSYPSYVKSANAILLGAQSVKPDIQYQYAVLSNIDMNEAYETTMNQIKNGADIVFGNANAGTLGVLKAAIDSPGVYALGALADYNADGPDTVLCSGVFDYSAGYIATVEKAIKGFQPGDTIKAGLADGCTGIIWNDNLKDKIPAEVMAQVEDAQAKIISGELKVPGDLDELIVAK
jgi:simple sugar transport system substrate-binding protein